MPALLQLGRGFLLVALLWPGMAARAVVATLLPESALVSGLAVGATSRSFQQLTLHEAIDEVRQSGAQVMEIHFGQAMSPAEREVVVNDAMTDEQIATLRRKISASSAKLVAARVRFSNNQSANTRLFEWAARLGIQVLVGDVPNEQFDNVERNIRRFNISVGLWTGPRTFGGSRASWTDPKALMGVLRGRDPRFGVVVNVLNLVRAGVEPFQALEDLRTRLHGVQITDLSVLSAQARAVPFGTGVFDFRRLLTTLDSVRFDGYLVFDWPAEDPEFRQDLVKGVEFIRTEMTAIRRGNLLRMASRETSMRTGLAYEVITQGDISEPVAVHPAPDGGVWVAGRRGDIWLWNVDKGTNGLMARVSVSVTGQRGVYGFAFDPGFQTNGHVFFYRSPMLAVGNSNRVSRFTAVPHEAGWRIPPESEHVLLDIPSASHGTMQGGGFLCHPVDGCLYVGTGDNNRPEETARFYDDPSSSAQDLADLRGKVLRIHRDGSVPADNPFVAHKAARPEIYAFGLRNPFTLSADPGTGNVYAGDVGYNRRQDWEEINLLSAGANYGWPRCDGRHRDTLAGTPCPIGEAIAPWFGYPHDSASSVLVGPFIDDGPPRGWPSAFSHGLVYADFSRRSVRFAQVDRGRNIVTNTIPIASGLGGGPVCMTLTSQGELFLVEYAGWLSANPMDRLSRIGPARVPVGRSPVRPPVVSSTAAGTPSPR